MTGTHPSKRSPQAPSLPQAPDDFEDDLSQLDPDQILELARTGLVTAALMHDLRNEWQSIEILSHLLKLTTAENETPKLSEIDRLQEHIARLGEFFRDATATHRTHPRETTVYTPEEEVHQIVQQISRNGKAGLVYDFQWNAPPDLRMQGFRSFFRRSVRNLLENAQAFATSKIHILAYTRADHLHLEIQDDGPGFPHLTHSPYRALNSQREEGTGLGLSSTRWCVHQMQGTLEISNRPGGTGAHVTVVLPLTLPTTG